MKVTLLKYPTDEDWALARRCALVTMGKTPTKEPDTAWKRAILRARHSPIRVLNYAFLLEGIPSNTATHLVRHVHAGEHDPLLQRGGADHHCQQAAVLQGGRADAGGSMDDVPGSHRKDAGDCCGAGADVREKRVYLP